MPLQPGAAAPAFETTDIAGMPVSTAHYRGRKLMISFFRFASCPYCNLRVHELAAKADSLTGKLNVIAVFQSPVEKLERHQIAARLPFHIIADPQMRLFDLYDGERSTAKFITGHLLHIPQWFGGVARGAFKSGTDVGELRLVPADFLIDGDGVIQHAHYGRDVTDHLPLRTITSFAAG